MHMADALVSPGVGSAMWAVSAGLIVYSSSRVNRHLEDRAIPLMGVLGAFVFAAQMVNFTIPATGSSGHLGGGLLLAILLGPYAAFLTVASILTVQALFFADGGILALGCNIFNLGFFPCLVAYPLFFKPTVGTSNSQTRIFLGACLAAIIGLQLGSLGVVLQTLFSGITELPFRTFVLFMQPIHLAIGIVEGLATASIVMFIYKARPDILHFSSRAKPLNLAHVHKPVFFLLIAALFTGSGISLLSSSLPDGLEWSFYKTTGSENVVGYESAFHEKLAGVQEKTALLPDYSFREPINSLGTKPVSHHLTNQTGTSVSGFIGSFMTLFFATLLGLLLKHRRRVFQSSDS